MHHRYKAFTEALEFLSSNPEKTKNYLKDKRPTQLEKKIIEAGLMLRDNRFQEAIEMLSPLSSTDPYIESQRLLTLGIAHNNRTDFAKGVSLLEASYKLGRELRNHQREFMTLYSLFTAYANLQKLDRVESILSEMKKMSAQNGHETISIGLCELQCLMAKQELSKAKEYCLDLKKHALKMNEHQKIFYILSQFSISVQLDDLTEARACMVSLKAHRKYRTSANFNFMKLLLDYIEESGAIYLEEADFKDAHDLLLQIRIIKCLSEDEKARAEIAWKELHELQPNLYGPNLCYLGSKNLFSVALAKAMADTVHAKNFKSHQAATKEETLLNILKDCKGPISKEQLYEFLYGAKPENKDELVKLAKLVSRIRSRLGLQIQTRKGCYVLMDQKE